MSNAIEKIERAIVTEALMGLLDAGYYVSVNDGEDMPINYSRDLDEILAALWAADVEWLIASERRADGQYLNVGAICLVYGNDGFDVMQDWSESIHNAIQRAVDIATS